MEWTVESRDDERMRKNTARRAQWERECKWHRWFAWYPVRITPKKRAWLCSVERRLDAWDRTRQPEWYAWDIRRFEYRRPMMDGHND